jgi:UDP-N-acetylmuramoyl-tripeptide--D-alanyl-D-alanine ligase
MKELGDEAPEAHREVGRTAAGLGVDVVVAVGDPARGIAEGAAETSGWAGETVLTAGRDEALAWVRENVAAGDVVLVKASRGAALEAIADGLLEGEGTQA